MLPFVLSITATMLAQQYKAKNEEIQSSQKNKRLRSNPMKFHFDLILCCYHQVPVELRYIIHQYLYEPISDANLQEAIALWSNDHLLCLHRFGPISFWDTSIVTNMRGLFRHQEEFNEPLYWDVSSVTDMSYMFVGASSFNQSLSAWNVSNVRKMTCMFWYARSFNQPLNHWDVSKVVCMRFMLDNTSYNQPLLSWNVSNECCNNSIFPQASTSSWEEVVASWKFEV
jgi:hypothetical protein